ncbi:MAG: hypothetical protein IKQ54_10045 [Oscillospiraceae bacterium]|nr:hypothetical protein [Oscillospiraceae bacterium]
MSNKEKKTYDAPEIVKIPLVDGDLDKVSGGAQPDGSTDGEDLAPGPDGEGNDPDNPGIGNGDIGTGKGRGGGCDGVAYHHSAKTFTSGRNSRCNNNC